MLFPNRIASISEKQNIQKELNLAKLVNFEAVLHCHVFSCLCRYTVGKN